MDLLYLVGLGLFSAGLTFAAVVLAVRFSEYDQPIYGRRRRGRHRR